MHPSNPPVMSRVHAFTSRSILKRAVPPAERSLRSDITHYMHGPLGMFAQRNPDASWDWMLHDGLGSVRGVFDGTLQSAAEYDPFGDPIVAPSGTAYGFTGALTDGSGLVYLRARYTCPKPALQLESDQKPAIRCEKAGTSWTPSER